MKYNNSGLGACMNNYEYFPLKAIYFLLEDIMSIPLKTFMSIPLKAICFLLEDITHGT